MTDKRPSDLILEWGLMPKPHGWSQPAAKPKEQEQQLAEQQREATRLELANRPPEPAPQNQPTLQGPGMGGSFVNLRSETPEQRQARIESEKEAQDRSKEPEPPILDKAAERVREIDEDRPGRRMLAPWERDPRWGA